MPSLVDKSSNRIPGLFVVITMLAAMVVFVAVERVQRPIPWQPGGAVRSDNDVARYGWPDGKLDINRASEAEFTVLPGIGPALAAKIVADRNANGPFGSVDDLDRVHGIGLKTIEWFRRYAVVRGGDVVQSRD